MIIYSNSCSYGVSSNGKVYSEIIADHFKSTLINNGLPGSCNQRIFRNSIRDVVDLCKKYSPEDILVMVGLTNTFRDEVWGTKNFYPDRNDGNFFSFHSPEAGIQESIFQPYIKQWFTIYDQEAAVTNLIYHTLAFSKFLQHLGVKYLIWANTPDLKPINWKADFVSAFYEMLRSDQNIIPLFEKNFVQYTIDQGHRPFDESVNLERGHPDQYGHKSWAQYLIKNYLS